MHVYTVTHTHTQIYSKGLFHAIMEAGKSEIIRLVPWARDPHTSCSLSPKAVVTRCFLLGGGGAGGGQSFYEDLQLIG